MKKRRDDLERPGWVPTPDEIAERARQIRLENEARERDEVEEEDEESSLAETIRAWKMRA